MSWSTGKDSALALHDARANGFDVTTLLVTVNAEADRVAMHAVRRALLEAQADRLGLALHTVEIPNPCPNDVYESRMAVAIGEATTSGVEHMVFGDLFLQDIREYRERALEPTGIAPVSPLWQQPTAQLARRMIDVGIRATVTCVDPRQLDASFAGSDFDTAFLAELPSTVDPCGENGEFHTFVWDGPDFRAPIDVEKGEVVERDGFVFADVLPK